MWRSGALPALAVGAAVAVVAVFLGHAELVGALLGTAVAVGALSVPVMIMEATRTSAPPAVMTLAVLGYGLSVVVLGVVWVLLEGREWLSGDMLGVALIGCSLAWTVGQMRGVSRLRIAAFGSTPDGGPEGHDTAGHAAEPRPDGGAGH
jgi:ATP synthase protein I